MLVASPPLSSSHLLCLHHIWEELGQKERNPGEESTKCKLVNEKGASFLLNNDQHKQGTGSRRFGSMF